MLGEPRSAMHFQAERLPPFTVIAKNGKINNDDYSNVQPRIGFAYSLTPRTVMRGSYGKFYWTIGQAVTENQSNYTSVVAQCCVHGCTQQLEPWAAHAGFANDPLNLGAGPIEPASSPFSPINVTFYTDPNLKTGYSDQWNFGFQQELAPGATATVNYVGSRNGHIASVVTANAAPTPGPGDPQQSAPYPYILANAIYGECRIQHLQCGSKFLQQIRLPSGIASTLAYTFSKALVVGCDGAFGGWEVKTLTISSKAKG